jgi:glycosyltransferase involved in cell wall biosynthesis
MLERVFQKCPSRYGIQGQKFLNLLIQGLSNNEKVSLVVLSKYSNRKLLDKKILYESVEETENGIRYIYLTESSYMGHLVPFISNLFLVHKWLREHDEGRIICDGLNLTLLTSTLFVSRIFGKPLCCVITDMPRHLSQSKGKGVRSIANRLTVAIWEHLISASNSFIVLTNEMNIALNPKGRPFLVIEGLVDRSVTHNTKSETKERRPICLYAGSLSRIYGIDRLVSAFSRIRQKEYELYIYGGGDFEEELLNICKKQSNIKYGGWLRNEDIVRIQAEVSLLINPRPTHAEYTRYSFPSKIMEYMLSGTPVLTTKLPSIPTEYFEYLYFFEDESEDGMAKRIESVLDIADQERFALGEKAKLFVRSKKNNTVQAERIISMLSTQGPL